MHYFIKVSLLFLLKVLQVCFSHQLGESQVISFGMRKIAYSTNQFGLDLLRASDRSDAKLGFCPFCISSSLVMLMMGSQGPMSNSLRHALYLYGMSDSEINFAYFDMMNHLGVNLPSQKGNVNGRHYSMQPIQPPTSLENGGNSYGNHILPTHYSSYFQGSHDIKPFPDFTPLSYPASYYKYDKILNTEQQPSYENPTDKRIISTIQTDQFSKEIEQSIPISAAQNLFEKPSTSLYVYDNPLVVPSQNVMDSFPYAPKTLSHIFKNNFEQKVYNGFQNYYTDLKVHSNANQIKNPLEEETLSKSSSKTILNRTIRSFSNPFIEHVSNTAKDFEGESQLGYKLIVQDPSGRSFPGNLFTRRNPFNFQQSRPLQTPFQTSGNKPTHNQPVYSNIFTNALNRRPVTIEQHQPVRQIFHRPLLTNKNPIFHTKPNLDSHARPTALGNQKTGIYSVRPLPTNEAENVGVSTLGLIAPNSSPIPVQATASSPTSTSLDSKGTLLTKTPAINAHSELENTSDICFLSNMYVQRDFVISYHYHLLLQKFYKTPIHPLDFVHNGEETRQHINAIVKMQTDNKINNILDSRPSPATQLLLISALYYNGLLDVGTQASGKSESLPVSSISAESKNEKIEDTNKESEGNVRVPVGEGEHFAHFSHMDIEWMQSGLTRLRYAFNKYLNCTTVEMPLKGALISFVIMMPNEPSGLDTLLTKLNAQMLNDVLNSLEIKRMSIKIPKMAFESSHRNLSMALSNLGLADLFRPGYSHLHEISDFKWLYVSDIIHKTHIDIRMPKDESSVKKEKNFSSKLQSNEFVVDKPFLFFIMDSVSGLIISMGKIGRESVYYRLPI